MSGKRLDKPTRKRCTTSKVIALGVPYSDTDLKGGTYGTD